MPDSPARERDWTALPWALGNAAQFAFTLAWTAGGICLALTLYALLRDRGLPLRMASRCWAPGLLRGAGARLRVEGLERVDWTRPCILVANHQSTIDICALFRAVPVPLRFVLKQEMARVPLVGRYARAMGMVFVERGERRAARGFLRQVDALLREGASLCVFPEGTRSRDGALAPFKGGAFQAAIDAGAQLVPVALHGSGAVLPPDGGFRVRPGTIRVRFGAPLAACGPQGPLDRQELAARAYHAVLDLLQERRTAA
ncbi:lysophospholipid acyltransferase family protein [Luteimonas aquatica]|uniref:lysophospholipid acyltransferase family protein n=1 Tax=Luteimonas aquatica TaxID=450364 RepID=UPI001F58444C|nr:lysophospholipid acyltransferase family protein [Luteimonas aquatica]